MLATGDQPVLAPVLRRARVDPVGRLLAAAVRHGIRFALSGATFVIDGAQALHPADREVLQTYSYDLRLRLEGEPPDDDLLERFGVDVELITTEARAREVIANLTPGVRLGFDTETTGTGAGGPRWIKVTRVRTPGEDAAEAVGHQRA